MDPVRDELPLEMAAAVRNLDARAAARAARVDVERVAEQVVERLRREGLAEPKRLAWLTPRALRIAAAVVVVAAAGATIKLAVPRPVPVPLPLPQVQAAIDSLSTGQMESVIKAAGEVRASGAVPAQALSGSSYDDLSDQQLQTLLASLGGAEG